VIETAIDLPIFRDHLRAGWGEQVLPPQNDHAHGRSSHRTYSSPPSRSV